MLDRHGRRGWSQGGRMPYRAVEPESLIEVRWHFINFTNWFCISLII